MKKSILMLSGLLVASRLSAQFPLDPSYYPSIGDSFVVYSLDETTLVEGNAGTGVTWDFTDIVGGGNTNVTNWVDITSTGLGADFPNAEIAASLPTFGGGSNYEFYSYSTGDWIKEGEANQLLTLVYGDLEKLRDSSMQYGDNFTDSFDGSGATMLGTSFRTGSVYVEYDGNGTALFPNNVTVNNVARLHVVESFTDSVQLFTFPLITQTENESYIFYEQGNPSPLVVITYATITTPGGPQASKTATSRVIPTIVSRTPDITSGSLTLWPNPVREQVNVKWHGTQPGNAILKVHDIRGNLVVEMPCKVNAGESVISLPVNALASGLWFLSLHTETGVETLKFQVP